MWQIKTFKTKQSLDSFMAKNANKYQMEIIFLNNAYGIEYRKLRVINL